MFRPAVAIGVILVLLALLGFHWITYPIPKGREVCIIAKDHMTFAETFVASDSQTAFTLTHPIFAGQMMMGKASCVSW